MEEWKRYAWNNLAITLDELIKTVKYERKEVDGVANDVLEYLL